MANNWTDRQKEAIRARGMEVLVSAAAGSGKTAVLSERVKNILCDEVNKCLVSEILVVTFTKAAAAEMCDRISKAMVKHSDEFGRTEYLRNQITMLPTADICTMDSFCAKLVRENFSTANVNFDFRVLDESERARLNAEAIDQVINELYEEDSAEFRSLTDMLVQESSDATLNEIIDKLYDFAESYPFPNEWIDSLAKAFDVDTPINDTPWAQTIYKYLGMFVDCYIHDMNEYLNKLNGFGALDKPADIQYKEKFVCAVDKLNQLNIALKNKSWDTVVDLINNELYISDTKSTSKAIDKQFKKTSNEFYKRFISDAKKLRKSMLPLEDEHKQDNKILYPAVSLICRAVKRVGEVLDEKKREMNAYSFSDVLHKAIDLLVIPIGDGKWKRTSLCEGLVERYKEILIDEYQDTNEAQDILFEALSRKRSNMYVVGDVKQSIYRFRKASPAIFMNLKRTLSKFDDTCKPSQISLDTNFRSRKKINDVTNYIFRAIMSESIGEIDYNDDEKMTPGADYYVNDDPNPELICIDCKKLKASSRLKVEAEKVAQYIYKAVNRIDNKIKVTVKGENGDFVERDIKYSDFCILLQTMKGKADHYVQALNKYNIPCISSSEVNISDYKEIRALIALLKTINNPMMDIALASVMLSPLFGFTSDEMAEIRLSEEHGELFVCLQKHAESNEKSRRLLDKLNLYRNISVSYPVDEFVHFIIDDTGIKDLYLADEKGKQRYDNIGGFISFASSFTKNIGGGLNSFIKHIDSAIENESFEGLVNVKKDDGVKIMSIHKSKGLEFPYVILANCSTKFNTNDESGAFTVSKEAGLGMQIRDDNKLMKYQTVSSYGNKLAIRMADKSERLRLLYVAITRAREKIIFVNSYENDGINKYIFANSSTEFHVNGKLHPWAVCSANNMSSWILTALSRHKNCDEIRDMANITEYEETTVDFGIDCDARCTAEDVLSTDILSGDGVDGSAEAPHTDGALLSEIKDKLSFEYGYNYDGVLAKRTASSTERKEVKREYFASSKPGFMKKRFTGADRGTAIHKFLEKCDFNSAKLDVAAEKDRLHKLEIMTEMELDVISDGDIRRFFDSDIVDRMLSSDEILKEYEFSMLKRAGDLYPEIDAAAGDEEIVVQGKLDCAFIEKGNAILIDYKSDGMTDENEYVKIYKNQIDIYSEALEKCKGCKVTERYIYSFKLNKFIEI